MSPSTNPSASLEESDLSVVRAKPGHGRPVDDLPADANNKLFPNAILRTGDSAVGPILHAITLREITMLGFINAVTDKPEWTKKVFDETIIAKWKTEAITTLEVPVERQMTEKMFDYCIKELQHRAKSHESSPAGAVHVLPGDVFKSDTAVSEQTKLALQSAVRVLENVPAHEKDWHPGSDGKVLDLVHPSLFPLVYGVSKILPIGAQATTLDDCIARCGDGDTIPAEAPYKDEGVIPQPYREFSKKFQWLPCEVDISGVKPKIATYINNLHPTHHRELYTVIEEIIGASLPLWDLTLAAHASTPGSSEIPRRITYTNASYETTMNEEDEPEQEEDEDDDAYYARYDAWQEEYDDSRVANLPEPDEFTPLQPHPPFSLAEKYGGEKTLQVIVKLANIELTPEKSEYEGGTWHVEGQMNEAICASAIYYYSSDNITSSSLAFRQQAIAEDLEKTGYEQNYHDWLPAVFGLENEGPVIQTLGSVDTREGRLVTFPNILQHRVQPFKLADPTKPGHRKIVALFLVDPNWDVISTADVPVQRKDWWQEELVSAKKTSGAVTPVADKLTQLPVELQDMVFEGVDGFPIDFEKAKEYREELMAETKKFVLQNAKEFEETTISLCEH